MKNLVLFAHGKESGPWGSKIKHLAAIAERHNCKVLSPDYSDLMNPDARVEIYAHPKKQARLYAEYVLAVDAAGKRTFRGSRLRPLTQKGLRRVLRDVSNTPKFHGRSHITQPGNLCSDLGIDADNDCSD